MTGSDAPHVITLGTAGGPVWWSGPGAGQRAGISTAVVVGDRTYIVDAGSGVGHRLMLAGRPMHTVQAIFITHLHSDHVVDLGSLVLFGMMGLPLAPRRRIPIIGPGDRGMLPEVSPRARANPPQPVFPDNPVPGTADLFRTLMRAYATDLNDRVLDSLRPSPFEYFEAQDVVIPEEAGFSANARPTPDMPPFPVYEDDAVRVTATLVAHPPIAPAFAYRFDTDGGSVVISGDTAPCENLVRLADGADVLLHEAIDFTWVDEFYGARGDEAGQAIRDHHRKSHTSPQAAQEIAERAGVRRLALHHLVPGTTPLERWYAQLAGGGVPFLIPSDLDRIRLDGRPAERLSHVQRLPNS